MIQVTGNDSDPDGTLDLASLSVVAPPSNGVVVILADGSISYEPAPDFFGTDSFSYRICDDDGECAVGTVSVEVVQVEVLADTVEQVPEIVEVVPDLTGGPPAGECVATDMVAESFTIVPASGSGGTEVDLRLGIGERGLEDCLPPRVRFVVEGVVIAGPVELSADPGASGRGEVPDLPPGSYEVRVETVTDPPVVLAVTQFDVTAGGGGGLFDVPPAVTVPAAAAAAGALIIGAAVWRRRARDHRHPPLDAPPPDADEDRWVEAIEAFDAAVESRDAADLAVARVGEAQEEVEATRAALAASLSAHQAGAYHLLGHENPAAPERGGRRGWFHPTGGRSISGLVVHAAAPAGSGETAADIAVGYAESAEERSMHAVVDAAGVVELLPDDHVAVHTPGSDSVTLGLQLVYPCGNADEDELTLGHAAAWIAAKTHAHDIPVRRLGRAEWTAGTPGLLDGRDLGVESEVDIPWERLLDLSRDAVETGAAVLLRTVTGAPVLPLAEQERADDAERALVRAVAAADEAEGEAAEAEARAEAVAEPWWDREARVPRHQVPTSPGDDEPHRRRDTYYLLQYENPEAEAHEHGVRGWYAPARDGPIDGIVVHTTQTEAAPEVADYYATSEHPVSAHVVVDDHGWVKLLPDEYVAYQARRSDNALGVEIAYRHDDWGTDPALEDVLLRMAAAWCAVRVRRHDIPVRELTGDEWRNGERGFVGHDAVDWRFTDPGHEFPWERFLTLVAAMAGVDQRSSV